MGPLAGAEFFYRFTAAFPALTDQQHPIVHIISDPTVGSRSKAVLASDPSVGLDIRNRIESLIALGVDVIAVPCNTAHHFISEFAVDVFTSEVQLADIVAATLIKLEGDGHQSAWLLGTEGTARSGIYGRGALDMGLTLRLPDSAAQTAIDECITAVKAGRVSDAAAGISRVCAQLTAEDDLPLLAACTELPIALRAADYDPTRYISTIETLVDHTIELLMSPAIPA